MRIGARTSSTASFTWSKVTERMHSGRGELVTMIAGARVAVEGVLHHARAGVGTLPRPGTPNGGTGRSEDDHHGPGQRRGHVGGAAVISHKQPSPRKRCGKLRQTHALQSPHGRARGFLHGIEHRRFSRSAGINGRDAGLALQVFTHPRESFRRPFLGLVRSGGMDDGVRLSRGDTQARAFGVPPRGLSRPGENLGARDFLPRQSQVEKRRRLMFRRVQRRLVQNGPGVRNQNVVEACPAIVGKAYAPAGAAPARKKAAAWGRRAGSRREKIRGGEVRE